MGQVSIRELRNHADDVIDRAMGGEKVLITRAGRPVAEIHSTALPPLSASTLLSRWAWLPQIDPAELRADIDDLLDPAP